MNFVCFLLTGHQLYTYISKSDDFLKPTEQGLILIFFLSIYSIGFNQVNIYNEEAMMCVCCVRLAAAVSN
jgi:hypothetical protein